MKIFSFPLLTIALSLILAACSPSEPKPKSEEPHSGLGEIMGLIQIHHAKLWFAASNKNWELADFELDELKECFEDVVESFPTHKRVPQPLTTLVPQIINPSLNRLQAAIAAKDSKGFVSAYDGLTGSCNGCHQIANMGYNVIKTPDVPPFSNQDYTPKAPAQPVQP